MPKQLLSLPRTKGTPLLHAHSIAHFSLNSDRSSTSSSSQPPPSPARRRPPPPPLR